MDAGGHLTHGSKVNFSGKIFHSYSYDLNPDTEELDYDAIRKLAREVRPQLIIAGASAYSRVSIGKHLRQLQMTLVHI